MPGQGQADIQSGGRGEESDLHELIQMSVPPPAVLDQISEQKCVCVSSVELSQLETN